MVSPASLQAVCTCHRGQPFDSGSSLLGIALLHGKARKEYPGDVMMLHNAKATIWNLVEWDIMNISQTLWIREALEKYKPTTTMNED